MLLLISFLFRHAHIIFVCSITELRNISSICICGSPTSSTVSMSKIVFKYGKWSIIFYCKMVLKCQIICFFYKPLSYHSPEWITASRQTPYVLNNRNIFEIRRKQNQAGERSTYSTKWNRSSTSMGTSQRYEISNLFHMEKNRSFIIKIQ